MSEVLKLPSMVKEFREKVLKGSYIFAIRTMKLNNIVIINGIEGGIDYRTSGRLFDGKQYMSISTTVDFNNYIEDDDALVGCSCIGANVIVKDNSGLTMNFIPDDLPVLPTEKLKVKSVKINDHYSCSLSLEIDIDDIKNIDFDTMMQLKMLAYGEEACMDIVSSHMVSLYPNCSERFEELCQQWALKEYHW